MDGLVAKAGDSSSEVPLDMGRGSSRCTMCSDGLRDDDDDGDDDDRDAAGNDDGSDDCAARTALLFLELLWLLWLLWLPWLP